jgi:hypothetical protein
MKIQKHLKTSVNRLVHRAAIEFEAHTKAMLIERLEAMREAGATEAEMQAYLIERMAACRIAGRE